MVKKYRSLGNLVPWLAYLCVLSEVLPVVIMHLVHELYTKLSKVRKLRHRQGNIVSDCGRG